ncbi:hypothetical protein BT96DRAFT_889761 [Gymnopus androsaceus JB14]|uniref:Pentacotripeptide-repeat region of PRORP domain-containing protein n=1 Tax=Gymnopus androsaceus JB14 TaxID=1447944 RepID=A0A6A4GVN0_9AGAR|nr:hypothetical protein BT96DRAFT_889761 [Gymnopus androsaceus JB14]
MTFYMDVLAHPEQENTLRDNNVDLESQHQKDLDVTESVALRLRDGVYHSSRLTATLREHSQVSTHAETSEDGATPAYQRVVNQVQQILSEVERVNSTIASTSVESSTALPMPLLSMEEWGSVLRSTLHSGDAQTAETLIELMKRGHLDVPEDYVNSILQLYVRDGNYVAFESCLGRLVASPSEQQRHLHVKAHLNATPSQSLPSSALSTLHAYELQSIPPPMKTYTNTIRHLLSVPNSVSKAQAWDLFSHMRYVAHPTPDAFLYTQMIRACASPFAASRSSDPERALDLWTEMTIDNRIPPSSGTWNAVILACARSGRKTYVSEAFRLAREMLDSHRDAHGSLAYTPDRETFCALLEGAKRTGDLARARWILAEMVRSRNTNVEVNEEVVMHVFHAYASYRPPFKRSLARVVEDESPSAHVEASNPDQTPDENLSIASNSTPAFTQVPPQTSTEVISEVELLFNRVLRETGVRSDVSLDEDDVFQENGKFSSVKLTTRLINSYLSTHYIHNSLAPTRDLFWNVFETTSVERDSRSYMEALERCANARKPDRGLALSFAEELFSKWRELEDTNGKPISPRTRERVHIAYLKMLTITENLDRAMSHLQSFVKRYPASAIREPQSIVKLSMRATRTSLVANRPLVRLSTLSEVPDVDVPSLLTWKDLEVLHHRLVAAGRREKDIAYIKYICKSYEWALRVRRDETMRAKPGRGEMEKVQDNGITPIFDQ